MMLAFPGYASVNEWNDEALDGYWSWMLAQVRASAPVNGRAVEEVRRDWKFMRRVLDEYGLVDVECERENAEYVLTHLVVSVSPRPASKDNAADAGAARA